LLNASEDENVHSNCGMQHEMCNAGTAFGPSSNFARPCDSNVTQGQELQCRIASSNVYLEHTYKINTQRTGNKTAATTTKKRGEEIKKEV
jgi:hypothetical protein